MTRRLAALLLAIAAGPGCSSRPTPATLPAATPGLELDPASYASARSRFRTTLIRPGPASRDRKPPTCPPDAVMVEYPSDGRTLQAFASPLGAGAKGRPAVLFLHGGFALGPAHWESTRPFRAAGYVVLIPTLRGENGQDGACSLFFDEVDDVLAAAGALAARPDVDPARLYLAGHSVGGTLTLLTALTSSRFRAAASFSAAPDLVEYTRGRPELIPFPPDHPAEFRMRSAVAFATSFRCPVRLFFGEDESWLQSATHRTALLAEQAGRDVAAVELPGGHESVTPASVATCLRFFRDQAAGPR